MAKIRSADEFLKRYPVGSPTIVLLLLLLYCTTRVVRVLKSPTHARGLSTTAYALSLLLFAIFFPFSRRYYLSLCIYVWFPAVVEIRRWPLIYLYMRCACVCVWMLFKRDLPTVFRRYIYSEKRPVCTCIRRRY